MGDLFYPQLSIGAVAQYPIRKTQFARTIKNTLPDGNMIVLPDSGATRTLWQLEYSQLSLADVQSLESHFRTCKGPLTSFTFIDPTGNMLASSTNLTTAAWQKSSLLQIQSGIMDPLSGFSAQTVVNYGQNMQELSQSIRVPANYQYCFSFFVATAQQASVTVFRRGPNSQQSDEMTVYPGWSRMISRGQLNDSGTILTVGIGIAPGQQVNLYGVQLEAQILPSRYQPTNGTGGVYTNAHWAVEQLEIRAEDVDSYATTVTIEAAT
jgi:hypothetical protein